MRFGNAGILPVAFPQVEKQSERHQPDFIDGEMQLRQPEIEQSGKQFLIIYPTAPFFPELSSSLWMFRLVPLYSASVMAVL